MRVVQPTPVDLALRSVARHFASAVWQFEGSGVPWQIEQPTAVDLVLHSVAMRFASFSSGAAFAYPRQGRLQMKQREAE